MIEYQGWVVIRESYNEVNESSELLDKIWDELKGIVNKINKERLAEICNLQVINGDYKLSILGLDNHKSSSWEEIVDLLKWLAKFAVGSYGLLYFYDDEDKNGLDNQFQVLVLKKGKVSIEKDNFLSPYIPEVEESD